MQRAETPQRRGPRPMLSRDEIAAAALDLIDEGGVDALSMRVLAAQLGVATMAIYRYFATKDELLDAVTEAALPGVTMPRPHAPDWQKELGRIFTDLYRALERHPGLVRMRLEAVPKTPRALAWTEGVLSLLTSALFSREEAVGAYRSLYTYTFGFAAFATADARARANVRKRLSALPRETYPEIVGSAPELARTLGTAPQFEFGLRRLIAGLAITQPTTT
jgi:TetR/AcrR family transcriptional regulator, tetracycline repressor protein